MAAFLGMVTMGYVFFKQAINIRQLPVYGLIKPFELIDEKGESFSFQNLYGKVWVANFFFTTCSDICPIMTKHMGDLSRTFEKVPGVKLASFTVNPEYDSSEVLREYANKQVRGKDNWHFLTGSREDIRKVVVESFKLGAIEDPIFHSEKFSLVDRTGQIRGYYDGTDPKQINQLFLDAAVLVKERF